MFQRHALNLQKFHKMLRNNGFHKQHIKTFFADSGHLPGRKPTLSHLDQVCPTLVLLSHSPHGLHVSSHVTEQNEPWKAPAKPDDILSRSSRWSRKHLKPAGQWSTRTRVQDLWSVFLLSTHKMKSAQTHDSDHCWSRPTWLEGQILYDLWFVDSCFYLFLNTYILHVNTFFWLKCIMNLIQLNHVQITKMI